MGNKAFDVTALGELLIDFTENGSSAQGNPMLEANPVEEYKVSKHFLSGNYQAMLTVDKSEVVSKTENELLDIGYDLVFDDLFVPVLFAFSHILQINHFEHILILERQCRFYGINGFGQHLKEVARQRSAI